MSKTGIGSRTSAHFSHSAIFLTGKFLQFYSASALANRENERGHEFASMACPFAVRDIALQLNSRLLAVSIFGC